MDPKQIIEQKSKEVYEMGWTLVIEDQCTKAMVIEGVVIKEVSDPLALPRKCRICYFSRYLGVELYSIG